MNATDFQFIHCLLLFLGTNCHFSLNINIWNWNWDLLHTFILYCFFLLLQTFDFHNIYSFTFYNRVGRVFIRNSNKSSRLMVKWPDFYNFSYSWCCFTELIHFRLKPCNGINSMFWTLTQSSPQLAYFIELKLLRVWVWLLNPGPGGGCCTW